MKYNIFFYSYPGFRTFFSLIQIQIFPDRIQIFGRSGSGLREKSLIRIREEKKQIRNTAFLVRLWSFRSYKFFNGWIRTFKTRIRIGENTRIHPDLDPKHCLCFQNLTCFER